jgi:predicted nucleic acid-binding Zn ribbon protein
MERRCLDCGEPLVGRIDKKFCNDQCRNNYNNRQNSEKSNYVRRVNTILLKNRHILADLNPSDKTTVHKEKLLAKGFDFKHITNIYTTQKGHVYYFCYEYGYMPLEKDFYMIVIREQKAG